MSYNIVLIDYYHLARHRPLAIYSPLYSAVRDSSHLAPSPHHPSPPSRLSPPLGHQRAVTLTSYPIDDLIRDHFIINDGTVLVRNATSSDSSCYALYTKIDPADDDTPIFDAGIVFGTGTLFFAGDGTTTTTTNDVRPREDTGEVADYDTSSSSSSSSSLSSSLLSSLLSSSSSSSPRGTDYGLIESHDTCRIRFDFQCVGDARRVIDFGYVFASEEYRDGDRGYVGTSSSAAAGTALGNDALTISMNGNNVALVPVYDDYGAKIAVAPIAIDTINSKTNSKYFVDHVLDGRIVSSEGFTVELGPYRGEEVGGDEGADASGGISTAVLPGWNTIEFVMGDVGDINVDSWAFLKANSFACVIADRGGGLGEGEGGITTSTGDATSSTDVTDRHWTTATPRISLMMAIMIVVVLGLIALSLPVIGLNFYKKRLLSSSKVTC